MENPKNDCMSQTLQGSGHSRICNLDLIGGHLKAILSKNESKEFQLSLVEFTFVFTGGKSMDPESLEYFLDVFLVVFHVIRADKNIIQID